MHTKTCKVCGTEKPIDAFYFRKDSNTHRNECKECWKDYRMYLKFNLKKDEYMRLLHSQDCKCAVCKSKLESSRYTRLAVDHDHKTGKVRGLLCTNCNTALGLMKDSPERFRNAIDYIESSKDIV